jgi:hypothetical protein
VSEPTGDDLRDALIREARQRARRRRWLNCGAVAVVAIAAVVASSILAGPPAPTPPVGTSPPPPPAAPLAQLPDNAGSTLIASWAQMGSGYVFVYGDGRVIWYPNGGVFVGDDGRMIGRVGRVIWDPEGGFFVDADGGTLGHADPSARSLEDVVRYLPLERRLSPVGLDLVRGGQLQPRDFVHDPDIDRREELWAEPTVRTYQAADYAICPTDVGRLPAPAQALLLGTQRTFDFGECFELTAAETATLYQILDADGTIDLDSITSGPGWLADIDFHAWVMATPIYPHGQPFLG